MEKTYNVHEALVYLQKHFITENIQVLTRHIREYRLFAEKLPNGSYIIQEKDLVEFVESKKPGVVEVMRVYDEHLKGIKKQNDEATTQSPVTNEMDEIRKEFKILHHRINELENKLQKNHQARDQSNMAEECKNESSQKVSEIARQQHKRHKVKTFEQFFKRVKKDLTKEEKENRMEEIKEIYSLYYDKEGQLMEGIYQNDKFCCPYTEKENERILDLFKEIVPIQLKKLIAKKET